MAHSVEGRNGNHVSAFKRSCLPAVADGPSVVFSLLQHMKPGLSGQGFFIDKIYFLMRISGG
jgi:hypothetical protein